jgi:hypothetical protein
VPYRLARLFALTAVYLAFTAAFLLVPGLNALAIKAGALVLFSVTILALGIVRPSHVRIAVDGLRYRLAQLLHRDGT